MTVERRHPSAGGRPVGLMLSSDDLKVGALCIAEEPRYCHAGRKCRMFKHSKPPQPQRLRRRSPHEFCEACRDAYKAPVVEQLRSNGHALRNPEPPFLKVAGRE